MGQSDILKEMKKLANNAVDSSDKRTELTNKIAASGWDSKTVKKETAKAEKAWNKARKEYEVANSEMASATERLNKAQEEMANARQYMMDLNQAAQTMALTGASAMKPEKGGDFSFVMDDGSRYHADCSNVEDIKLTPWKEWKKNREDEDSAADGDAEEMDPEDFIDKVNAELDSSEESQSADDSSYVDDALDFGKFDHFLVDDSNHSEDSNYSYDNFGFHYAAPVEKSVIKKIAKKFR